MKRKLSLLMVLMMVVALVPVNSAFAASTAVVNTAVTSEDGLVVFNIDIEAKGTGIDAGDVFELQLNGDADFVSLADPDNDATGLDFIVDGNPGGADPDGAGPLLGSDVEVNMTNLADDILSSNRVEFEVMNPVAAGTSISIEASVLLDGAEGEQTVTVQNVIGSSVSRQTLTFAVVSGSGNVIARTLESNKSIYRGTNKDATNFELREATQNAIELPSATNDGIVTLRLPKEFSWYQGATGTEVEVNNQVLGYDATPATVNNAEFAIDNDGRDLLINLTAIPVNPISDSATDRIIIAPHINVTKDAKIGDIMVQVIGGDTEIDVDDIKIGTYKEYSVVLEADEVQSIVAGKTETTKDYVVEVTVNQNGANLIGGRDIDFTVEGGKVSLKNATDGVSNSDVVADDSKIDITDGEYDDAFTVSLPGAPTPIGSDDVVLELYVSADWDASGEMTLTAKGAGMEEQTIKIADVMAPAKITTKMEDNKTVADVIVGLQEQMAPELVLTETEAGSLSEGFYVFDFSAARYSGIEFIEEDIDFEVTGDLEVEDVYVSEDGEMLIMEVDGESSNDASVVTISGIKVTLDRTVPFGAVDIRFGASVDVNEDMVDPEDGAFDEVLDIVAKTPFLNVVTAVQDERKQQTVFTIDSVTYTVGSETRTLDAAPFISMNRTMLPIGTVANLVGATVNYSPASRTAVFTKDNLVVSMNLDTNVLLVNGSPVMMDAKPMIVNSRAFVPVVYVAQAFGIQNGTDIVYDAAARTVTLFPEVEAN